MSPGRSGLDERGGLADLSGLDGLRDAASGASTRGPEPQTILEARRQIDALRSINLKLTRQLVALKRREAEAQRRADRDGLTGLYNRRKMLELLDGSIAAALRHGHRVGLLFIDVDGFKPINDQLGHAAGDRLLMTLAARISGRVRTGDSVCRYGGDEFVVILPKVADAAAVLRVADSIARRVALPYRTLGPGMRVTAAIGAAIYPDEARTAMALLRLADAAMYRAKSPAAPPRIVIDGSVVPARRRDDVHKPCKGDAFGAVRRYS